MSNAEWTARIGAFVRASMPAAEATGRTAYGRVCAIETYTDDICTRKWIYVRWIDIEGRPNAEPLKHAIAELEPYESETCESH